MFKDNKKIKKHSSQVYIALAILVLIISYLLASFFTFHATVPSRDEVIKAGERMELDDTEIISAYKLVKERPKRVLGQGKDLAGNNFYLTFNYDLIKNLSLVAILSLTIIIFLSYNFIMAYRAYIKESAVQSLAKLSDFITEILSGSSQRDVDKVFEEIRPIFSETDLSKTKIEETVRKLFQAEKTRRDFTASVTHELKTPLTSINGYAEMMASGLVGPDKVQDFSKVILEEGRGLLQMIDEIITLSHYQNQTSTQLNYQDLRLDQTAKATIGDLTPFAKSKHIDLSLEAEPITISADPGMVYELISNLLSNAIKYNVDGGWVKVKVADAYPYAKITVSDSGIGISKEDQKKIFDSFYMAHSKSRHTSGTGLGLALVKHIVENHGGKIVVISDEGKGTSFIVSLPYSPQLAKEEDSGKIESQIK